MKKIECDVVVIGSGVAGLICSLELSKTQKVVLVTKKELKDSNSYLAQGGISVLRDYNDREDFIEDTLLAGHYKNDRKAVEVLVDESRDAIKTLIEYGVEFNMHDEKFSFTKEGGHRKCRILYHDDVTGKAIMEGLIDKVLSKKEITILENSDMEDILEFDNRCVGIFANIKGQKTIINASNTVLATGGIGGIYKNTTSFHHIKGDGIGLAIRHNIRLKDISYVQIHPTALYEKKDGRRFLISESVRGEGAKLLNQNEERFVDELKPRDFVANTILREMEKDKSEYEWLNFKPIDKDIKIRFPNICTYLGEIGINPEEQYVPITPAQHYTMGGIQVDLNGNTSMKNLYAIGEVACTGVHGQNRLASNSLLECVVFGRRAARHIRNKDSKLNQFDNYIRIEEKLNDDIQCSLIMERIEEDKYEKTK